MVVVKFLWTVTLKWEVDKVDGRILPGVLLCGWRVVDCLFFSLRL